MAKDRIVIPGIPTDAARVIIDRMREQEERLALLERRSGRPGIVTVDTAAKVGEFLNIEAPTAGLTIILPQATQALRNARVTLSFRNSNPVRIVCVLGTVNGEASALNNLPGTYDAICDGLGGWAVQVGVTEDGVIGTPSVPGALAPIPGLSVIGNDGVVAAVPDAITGTAARQVVRVDDAGTALEWGFPIEAQLDGADIGSAHTVNVEGGRFALAAGVASLDLVPVTTTVAAFAGGTYNAYVLPATVLNGDHLQLSILGAVTLNGIDATGVADGFEFTFGQNNGGLPDGNQLTIVDEAGAASADNRFGTPDNISVVIGTGANVRIRRVSPRWIVVERGFPRASTSIAYGGLSGREVQLQAAVAGAGMTMTSQVLNVIGSTSITVNANDIQRPALTGFAAASANSNATTSAEPIVTYSASANMSAERVTTNSTSITVSTSVASQIEFQRAALTGDVTAAANSNATTIANDAVTNAKAANMAANTVKANPTTGSADPQDLAISTNEVVARVTGGNIAGLSVGTDTAVASIGEGNTSTGLGAQSRDDMARWLNSQTNVRVFEEEFQGNLDHHFGSTSRFTLVSLAGVALSTLSNSTGEYTGAINLSTGAGNGTTRGIYTLGANESAFNFHWNSLRYFSVVFRTRLATTANTHWALGLVGPFSGYGAVTASVLAGTSEGIFIEGVTNLSANFRVGRRTGSATAATDTGVAVADNRFQFEFFRTSGGDDYYYLNGALIRTDASGIAPTGTACTFFYSIIGSTTAERAVELDHLKVVLQSSNRFT